MDGFYRTAGFLGFVLTAIFAKVLVRRIKTKIFIGDGGNAELAHELQQLNDFVKCAAIGLILLAAVGTINDGDLFTELFVNMAGGLLLLGCIIQSGYRRMNGVVSFSYVIGRAMIVTMIAATSLYLLYLYFSDYLATRS